MKRILLLISSFVFVQAFSEDIPEWHTGVVVLKDQEVLTGEVSIQPLYDVLLFRSGETITVFPAHKITSAFYYDEKANINRKFISIESVAHPVFNLYEIVVAGEMKVVRRMRNDLVPDKAKTDALGFNYFVQKEDQLVAMNRFRREFFPEILKIAGHEITAYIKEKRLNPNEAADAIQIIKFYNQRMKGKEMFAMN